MTLFAVSSCVSTPGGTSLPGETLASPTLQRDILQVVLMIDMATDSQCRDRRVVNTKILARSASERTERWTVNRCGKLVNYTVTISPDPTGGSSFRVRMNPAGG